MNAAVDHYEGQDIDYRASNRTDGPARQRGFKQYNRPKHSRRGAGPRQHNGIHRRRRKKIQW